ncbi:hypothetical protein [Phenylobacterium sp.]|uniref:hypothetical protein n=1 Tax=Phenylobacterium sp. TaxID=1871053 RepID=UPI002CA9AB6D|nr:hypothetical protein [Phenylobacterium sp.]HVI32612.1 hypothetical protein [Phenylobacterium sp.]
MAEHNHRPPHRNGVVAGVFVSLLAVALIAAVLLAWPRRSPPPAPAPAAPPPAAPAPTPLAPPPLGRAELVAAARAAAAAYAAGAPAPEAEAALAGRAFRVRLPFGCLGVSPAVEPAAWRYDEARGTLTLTARAVDWTGAALARGLPGAETVEAVEGFWIPRPWLEGETCPSLPVPPPAPATSPAKAAPKAAAPPPAAPPPPSPQTVGLAEVFREGGSRVFRRGERPYQVVEKAEPPTGPHVYHLVLEGRVVAGEDGRAVRCRAETADRRPVCVVTVEFDRVAFEDPAGGEVLGEWRR